MNRTLEILIVEDDELDRMIIKRAVKLSGLNINLHFAEDVDSGMEAASGKEYDCIFLDYNLPGGNGLELLRKIKAEGNASPIIIVTSHGDENIAVDAMKSGAVDYVPKSLMTGEGLSQSLRHVIRLKEADTEKKKIEQALRETEHRLQAIVSNTPIILFAFDTNGIFTLFEGKGVESLKVDKNEIIGKPMQSFDSIFPQVNEIFERTMNGEVVNTILELNETYHQAYYTPIRDRYTNKITGVIGVSYDITQHKRAEEELISAKKLAEDTAKLKEQFLANMSHEIRTPLNGIVGLTRILANTALDKEQSRFLNLIQSSSEDLMVIINDILDVSKIEAGRMSFENTDFNLHNVVKQCTELFEIKALEKNINLIIEIDSTLPTELKGDPVRLGQILNNLVGNAIKFTHHGCVMVIVKSRSERKENVTLDFIVKDTGIGMAEDCLSTIFNSFTQASSDTTRKFGGTGLGLTIVKNLIELQGGSIQVKSKENEGTTFCFHLTFNKKEGSQFQENTSKSIETENIGHLSILLAEDNMVNRLIVQKIFAGWEVPLDCAENGKQVLEMISSKKYDIILMDIQMPEMDGYEACMRIRQNADERINKIPIIALTAHAMSTEKEKCLKLGMNDYLCKPFDPISLKEKISQLTALPALTNETMQINNKLKIPTSDNLPDAANVLKQMGNKIDLTYLKQIADGNDQFIIEMIELFLQKTPAAINEMVSQFEKKNWDELRMIAHRIKPSFSYVGAHDIQKDLSTIESYSLEKINLEKIGLLIEEVNNSSVHVFGALQDHLQNLK